MINPEITSAIKSIIAPTTRRMAYCAPRVEEGEDRISEPCLFIHRETTPDAFLSSIGG